MPRIQAPRSAVDAATVLRWIYLATSVLAAHMIVWILIFPASTFISQSKWRLQIYQNYMVEEPPEAGVVSPDVLFKFSDQFWIQVTHILPGALWAAVVPLQIHAGFRKRHVRLHRFTGCIFVITSLLSSIGVMLIIKKGLVYENFYPDLPPLPYSVVPGMIALTAYFVGTVVLAVWNAVVARNFQRHSQWIIRHVAAGIWVSLQRILLGTVLNRPPFTREQQRAVFANAAWLAMATTFLTGEYAIVLLNQQRKQGKLGKKLL